METYLFIPFYYIFVHLIDSPLLTFKWVFFLNRFGHAMHWLTAKGLSISLFSLRAGFSGCELFIWSQIRENVAILVSHCRQVKIQLSACSNQFLPSSFGCCIRDKMARFSAIIFFLVFSFFVSIPASIVSNASSFGFLLVASSTGPKSTPKSSSGLNNQTENTI